MKLFTLPKIKQMLQLFCSSKTKFPHKENYGFYFPPQLPNKLKKTLHLSHLQVKDYHCD